MNILNKDITIKLKALLCSFAILGLLIAGSGCTEEEVVEAAPEIPRNVRIVEMKPGKMTEYFEISGPVAPVRGADLSAQESGSVLKLSAAKGHSVKKGEIIIEQDRRILKAEMQAALSSLETQSYNVDKVRKLNEAGKISRIELLNAESLYESARAMADVSVERHERAAIKAPFDGIIVERYVEVGQLVQPGYPVVRIIDPSVLKLEAYLTDQEVPWVVVGSEAWVDLAESSEPVKGKVTWVALEADRMTGKFKMELEIPNAAGHLRSGVIARARIQKNIIEGVLSIPRDAVLHSRAGTSVFVVIGNDQSEHAYRRFVILGTDQGSLVTVDKGLKSGDRLVVRGHRALRDSSLVKVTEISDRTDGMISSDPKVLLEGFSSLDGSKGDNR